MLTVSNLSVSVDAKPILDRFSFTFAKGKSYALLGPNGCGKSTLAQTLMGHPHYTLKRGGKILLGGKDIARLTPEKRATRGLFLAFQNPLPLPGIRVGDLLRLALEKKIDPVVLHKRIRAVAEKLHIKEELLERSLNDDFSGGEKKKLEALQAILLAPSVAIFDEIDTGVDVDALKQITTTLKRELPAESTTIFITHSAKLLKYIRPDEILVMKQGRLVATGGMELAKRIESDGFDSI